MNLSIRVLRLGVCAVVAGAVAAVGITTASGESSRGRRSHQRVADSQALLVPAQLSTAFSIFRRAPKASHALPRSTAVTGLSAQYGLNPRLARYAGSAGGSPVWLVPGSVATCIILATGAGACGSNAAVAQEGAFVGLVPTSGAATSVIGIVPDGTRVVTTDSTGRRRGVDLSGNAFDVTSADHVVSFTLSGSGAGPQTIALPDPHPPVTPSIIRRAGAVGPGASAALSAGSRRAGAVGPGTAAPSRSRS